MNVQVLKIELVSFYGKERIGFFNTKTRITSLGSFIDCAK